MLLSRRHVLLLPAAAAGCKRNHSSKRDLRPADLRSQSWSEVEARARGTGVSFGMWGGDQERNRLFRGSVAETLKKRFDVALTIVPFSDTVEAVNKLIDEKAVKSERKGSLDVLWINGENFRLAKEARVLWGPFGSALPNNNLYPATARARDFGTEIDDFEAPWQRAHFVFAYDSARLKQVPRSVPELLTWIRTHPGRFTHVPPPDFNGSAFVRHCLVHFAEGASMDRFDESLYSRASAKALAALRNASSFFWRQGETYPSTGRELDRLFANQEVDFSMSYGPAFASVRIERGEFPATTRTFVLQPGTLGNYNYLAIPFNSPNPSGALTTINYLQSFESAVEFSRVLKTSFPLDLQLLTASQREEVERLPRGVATLSDQELSAHFLPEPHAEYLTRFEKDWREQVLRR
ncbi:MAG TPA: ABC transporter substrate-binding protein [Bryobacteraceae bacterium]|nr:ABC transporter substrate-binding protein [Bryobacteraceae bacterium]